MVSSFDDPPSVAVKYPYLRNCGRGTHLAAINIISVNRKWHSVVYTEIWTPVYEDPSPLHRIFVKLPLK